jgi:hypothetical protein
VSSIDRIIIHFTSMSPFLLVPLIIAGIFLALWYYRDPVPPATPKMKALLVSLRAAALAILFIGLAEPVVKILFTITHVSRAAVLFDTSSSMEKFGEGQRKQEALDALKKIRANLGNRGEYLCFDDRIHQLDRETPAFIGPATDITQALKSAMSVKDVSAVILVTDGRWNRGEDPAGSAVSVDVPVYTILTGPAENTPDIMVRRVSAAPVGHDGTSVPVEIIVASTVKSPGAIPVEILERGHTVVSGNINLGEAASGKLTLDLPLKEPGDHLYTVRVSPAFAESRENNIRSFGVHVLKSSFAILLTAPAPSSDLAFLRRALEADKSFTVQTVIGTGAVSPNSAAWPDDIAKFDAVVLVDGGSLALDPERSEKLVSWLSAGKGLWILGASSLTAGSAGVESALPVVISRGAGIINSSFSTVLTEPGKTHFITAGPNTAGLWEMLPPLTSIMPVTVNSQGHSLAVAAGLNAGSPPLPVIVAGTYGRGKTLVMPVSGIWRWELMMVGAGKDRRILRFPGKGDRALADLGDRILAAYRLHGFEVLPERAGNHVRGKGFRFRLHAGNRS